MMPVVTASTYGERSDATLFKPEMLEAFRIMAYQPSRIMEFEPARILKMH